MHALEHSFIYYPSRDLLGTPADLGLPYDDIRFGPNERLHGWFLPAPSPAPLTLLYFHGNAGNIGHRLPWLQLLRDQLGVSLFIFDYQGYGISQGSPSEPNTYQDARDALAYLRSRPDVDPARLAYLGKSLGGAIALQLAVEQPPYRLILQSSFTSLADLARLYYPFVPAAMLRTRYDSLARIPHLRAPLLIVHGKHDELVPLDHARRLHAAASDPKHLLVVPAAHNDVLDLGGPRYFTTLRTFLTDPPFNQ